MKRDQHSGNAELDALLERGRIIPPAPDVVRARALVRASGTQGSEVEVGEVIGTDDGLAPYVVEVLRSLGYRASVRRFPDFPEMFDPASGLEVTPFVGYFPDYPALYDRQGWTMFQSIDRVYDAGKAARKLGFTCGTGFREVLDGLKR